MRVSIRIVLPIQLVLIAVISALILGLVIYDSGITSVNESVQQLRRELTGRRKLEIEKFFAVPVEMMREMQASSRIPGVFNYTNVDTWDYHMCTSLRHANLPMFIGTERNTVVSASISATGQCIIYKIDRNGFVFNATLNFNAHGIPFYAGPVRTYQDTAVYDINSRSWYIAARNRSAWTDTFVNFFTGVTQMNMGMPMWDTVTGRNVGVFAASFSTAALRSYLSTVQIARSGQLALLERRTCNVIGLSWDEPVVYNATVAVGNATTTTLRLGRLENYTEPLLRDAVAAFGADELCGRHATNHNHSDASDGVVERVYGSGRKRVFVDLLDVHDEHGLDLRVIVLIPEADFLTAMWDRSDVASWAAVGAVAGVTLLAVGLLFVMLRPLKQLEERMYRAAVLGESSDGGAAGARSVFSEVAGIQLAFERMNENLQRIKCFVPLSILQMETSGSSGSQPGSSTSANPGGAVGSTKVDIVLSISQNDQESAKRQVRAPKSLNPMQVPQSNDPVNGVFEDSGDDNFLAALDAAGGTSSQQLSKSASRCGDSSGSGSNGDLKTLVIAKSTVASQVNTFVTRRCTAVGIEWPTLPTGDPGALGRAVARQMAAVVRRAVHLGGVLETMSPDFLLVTFNAHFSCVMHEERAVAFATRVLGKLQRSAVVAVDTTDVAVGTAGVEDRKARVVVGECVDAVRKLTALQRAAVASRLVVTERCARGVPNRAFALVESVAPRWHQAERARIVHVCVTKHGEDAGSAVFSAEHRAAYSALMRGRVREAAAGWRAMAEGDAHAANDVHVRRLLAACAALAVDELGGPYARAEPAPWSGGAGLNSSGRLNASDTDSGEDGQAAAVAQHIEAAFVAPAAADNSNDDDGGGEALFSMFGADHTTQSTTATALVVATAPHASSVSGGAHGETCSAQIADIRGVQWSLSRQPIAGGAYSEVYQGLSATGALAAVKVMRASSRSFDVAAIQNEVQVLVGLRHEHIVPYVSVAVEGREAVYIIMELAAGGSLRDLIGRFGALDASIVRRFTVDTLKGLQYLHAHGVTHADMKPHNLLLSTEGVCKLADFGSALNGATAFEGSWDALRGTSWYAAPEVCAGERPTPASDVWSLAITLLEMATGAVPWSVEQRSGNREAVFLQRMVQWTKGGPAMVPAVPETLPADLRSTVTRCLQLDPAARPTCADLLASEFIL